MRWAWRAAFSFLAFLAATVRQVVVQPTACQMWRSWQGCGPTAHGAKVCSAFVASRTTVNGVQNPGTRSRMIYPQSSLCNQSTPHRTIVRAATSETR
ncbi:hypothetical protein V8F20_001977 [Naviculisporaceae sp. PSN 640]